LRWYQPAQDLAELPPFVATNPDAAKSSPVPSLVRMETPVLYFYPPRPMTVRVRACLRSGNLTEWFPSPAPPPSAGAAGNPFVTWSGRLVPPGDAAVRARVPQPIAGKPGAHYFHARGVPDAWLFQSDAPIKPGVADERDVGDRRGGGHRVVGAQGCA